MSYVDAVLVKDKNRIDVVERVNGKRVYNSWPSKYVVYWPSEKGKYTSIYGEKLDKFETTRYEEFQRELRTIPQNKQYESDINPIFRCFYDHYKNAPTPKLNIAFFDIESDFDPKLGFSSPEDAFNPLTAVSVYLSWVDKNYTLVIKPKTLTTDQAQEIVDKFDDTLLCKDEAELLDLFLSLIEDADIISGWNSTGYDIPYIHNRIIKVLNKDSLKRLCLWNKLPKKREYKNYGKDMVTYDLIGRVHLDYLELYRKHTYHEMHSYSLDAVGEYEVKEKKVPYQGTLDTLYNNDFEKFIEYNRQDVMLLVKIDKKLKFIELSNALAHDNGVLFSTTLGSVLLIDNAITNEAHDLGLMIPARIREYKDNLDDEESHGIAGAFVAEPVVGMHQWIGGVDINSLYPSTIRALNMSKETLVGQIRQTFTEKMIQKRMSEKKSFAEAWNDTFSTLEYNMVMNKEPTILTVDFEDGTKVDISGEELYRWIFENPKKKMTLSANGTIFSLEKEGIISSVLSRWYTQRKELQKEAKKFSNLLKEFPDNIEYKQQAEFYDRRQLIRKILLNSLYGAVGNSASKFFDERIAQSTTLCGRCIVRHMGSKINDIIEGKYDHKGMAVIYGDTDSIYFSAYPVMKDSPEFEDFDWDKDTITKLYDQIADMTNQSFPDFMKQSFNVPETRGEVIKAGRELCATTGLFITKKRYAVMIYDKEGERKDIDGKPGSIKAMGLDIKRADTSIPVREFLSYVLEDVLTNVPKEDIFEKIKNFRNTFNSWPSWAKGTPKRVNNLTMYGNLKTKLDGGSDKIFGNVEVKKKTIPGHVLASLNWNKLCEMHNDNSVMKIMDGQKVIVCKLRQNPYNMTSVAYPIDETRLPDWFKALPFDNELMEETVIDKKLTNLLGVLEWNLDSAKSGSESFNDLFSF